MRTSLLAFGRDSGRTVEDIVLSSNVAIGIDKPSDPGVAAWFRWDGDTRCIAVDRYATTAANLQAIHHVIEARRTELRHGTLAMIRASFEGLKALPAPAGAPAGDWRQVLAIAPGAQPTREDVEHAYRRLARDRHPDRPGGSEAAMAALNAARDQALRAIA